MYLVASQYRPGITTGEHLMKDLEIIPMHDGWQVRSQWWNHPVWLDRKLGWTGKLIEDICGQIMELDKSVIDEMQSVIHGLESDLELSESESSQALTFEDFSTETGYQKIPTTDTQQELIEVDVRNLKTRNQLMIATAALLPTFNPFLSTPQIQAELGKNIGTCLICLRRLCGEFRLDFASVAESAMDSPTKP